MAEEDDRLDKLLSKYSINDKELKQILKSANKGDLAVKTHKHYFSRKRLKIGVASDLHWGHQAAKPEYWHKSIDFFKREKVDAVYLPGDIAEGMSGRPGHIFELSHIGATAQLDHCTELLKQCDIPIYAITGNHDEWFMNKNNMGLNIGKILDERVDNFHHVGDMEAIIKLTPNVNMLMYHGRDGTAYATSYKMQKLMESFTGGDKPNIILSGHYHKALYMFNRNIHGIEAGTLCGQTPFMRGKKIPAHVGAWTLDMYFNKTGVERLKAEFLPFYK